MDFKLSPVHSVSNPELSHSIMANPGKMTSTDSTEIDSDISEDDSEDLGTVDLDALEESLNENGDVQTTNKTREKDPRKIRTAEIKQVRLDMRPAEC